MGINLTKSTFLNISVNKQNFQSHILYLTGNIILGLFGRAKLGWFDSPLPQEIVVRSSISKLFPDILLSRRKVSHVPLGVTQIDNWSNGLVVKVLNSQCSQCWILNCLLVVALQPWDIWTPPNKRGHKDRFLKGN